MKRKLMPKQKTHKTTVKRVKITGSGRIFRVPAAGNHLLTNKSKRKNNYLEIDKSDAGGVKKRIGRG